MAGGERGFHGRAYELFPRRFWVLAGSSASSLSSFGGEGQGEEVVGLSERA
jgi:hypothetical protein